MTTTIYASQCGARLDSDVLRGGGTDDTRALQAALDQALTLGHLRLVLDGAALISAPLKLHSNTTLVCPDASCGLYLAAGSNCCLLRNVHFDLDTIHDHNISILGGSFNHNALGQEHNFARGGMETVVTDWVIGMEFYGVKNMVFRDVTILNQRTFTMLFSNWEHVEMDNIYIDLQQHIDFQNQDGLHFWGPGRFLNIRNIRGSSGDDFIALAPDENDFHSSITDVLIDGVQLEGADQGIRLLSRDKGRLDRVLIKNVTGTYKSYGFIVNPWFDGCGGDYGNIVFDTIDLRPLKNNYDYTPPFLFKIGGNIESLTIKNLYQHRPAFNHRLIECGGAYMRDLPETAECPTNINRLLIDGLYIDEADPAGLQDAYIRNRSRVEALLIQNVHQSRAEGLPREGVLLRNEPGGTVGEMRLHNVALRRAAALTEGPLGSVERLRMDDVEVG